MLKRALLYKDELMQKTTEAWTLDNKYYFGTDYNLPNLVEDTWDKDQFVCINKNGEVIGYVYADKYQTLHQITSLGIICFSKNLKDSTTLLMDVQQLIYDYFIKYNYDLVRWIVYVGNPIEKFYDKYIAKVGGKVCGYERRYIKCLDGSILDRKTYEITREEYHPKLKETID